MPIIREISNLEKIILMYYGKSKSKILNQTHHSGLLNSLRVNASIDNYFKTYKRNPDKFKSSNHLFYIKFNSSMPEFPLKMEEIYLKRRSHRDPFQSKKISRSDLEKILKWGIFYNEKNNHFTVPCG